MRLADYPDEEEGEQDPSEHRGGLLYGVGPWHVHVLCSSPMHTDGGYGMSIQEVGDMTLDSIMCVLADRKLLESRGGGTRGVPTEPHAAATSLKADADGMLKGLAEDGTPIKAKIKGKSLARRLMEEEEAKKDKGKGI